MGWHVHYKRPDGRVGVYLVCNRETAMNFARRLTEEKREVIRLCSHDGAERLAADELASLIPGAICGMAT
jgi:hypothetical protein